MGLVNAPFHLHPLATAALTGASLIAVVGNFQPADFVIFAVAVAAALASYRTRQTDAVRKQNADLAGRNAFLEAEQQKMHARLTMLEQRPDVDALATQVKLLAVAVDANGAQIRAHDASVSMIAAEQLTELRKIAAAVEAN